VVVGSIALMRVEGAILCMHGSRKNSLPLNYSTQGFGLQCTKIYPLACGALRMGVMN